jgi:hypothetical protein
MNTYLTFGASFLVILIIIVFLDLKFYLLRDVSTAVNRPYSLSRVQLAWWTTIIFSAATTILFKRGVFPAFDQSTLILLGISSATAASARIIDLSDQNNTKTARHQDSEKQGFFLDILSDENGASIHRLQTVLFNLILGVWFVVQVIQNVAIATFDVNKIIPVIDSNNLVFLGISTATYVALKSSENKAEQPANSTDGNPSNPQG